MRIFQSLECTPLPHLEELKFTFNVDRDVERLTWLNLLLSFPVDVIDGARRRWLLRRNIKFSVPDIAFTTARESLHEFVPLLSCTLVDFISNSTS